MAAAGRELCPGVAAVGALPRGSSSAPGPGRWQQTLPNDRARTAFPRSSSRTRCALAREAWGLQGPAGSSVPEKPEMGTTGKAPPEARASLGRSAGPRSSRLRAEVLELPASPPVSDYFWLPS